MGRPDGQLCDQNFKIFTENLSCLRAASGRWGSVLRMVKHSLQVISLLRLRASGPWGWPSGWLIFYTQFPYLLNARPDHDRLTSRGLSLNCELALRSSASGQESTSSGRLQQSSQICFWKENLKLDHWESSGRAAESSRQMQAGIEASRFRGVSGRKSTSSGRMMLWYVGRPDSMVRCPNGWNYG
jgi:hypothetical protein